LFYIKQFDLSQQRYKNQPSFLIKYIYPDIKHTDTKKDQLTDYRITKELNIKKKAVSAGTKVLLIQPFVLVSFLSEGAKNRY